jgi:hypothetical protein
LTALPIRNTLRYVIGIAGSFHLSIRDRDGPL